MAFINTLETDKNIVNEEGEVMPVGCVIEYRERRGKFIIDCVTSPSGGDIDSMKFPELGRYMFESLEGSLDNRP